MVLLRTMRRFMLHRILSVFCIIFLIVPLFSNLDAETVDKKKEPEELESDLPEVIKARVIDITHIQLNPRARFEDTVEPLIGQSLGIYPKERLWNLPDILTPSKVDLKKSAESDNYLISLEARPRLPGSFLYNVLFAGDIQPIRGLINIDSQHLGDKFTKNRGEYNLNRFHTSVGYSSGDLEQSAGIPGKQGTEVSATSATVSATSATETGTGDLDLDADIQYETKELGWLREETEENETVRKELTLLKCDFDWSQSLTDETQMTLDLNGDLFRISEKNESNYDEGVNLGLNLDISTYWPFINPINFGGGIEYFSADSDSPPKKGKTELPAYTVYARNHYAALGPFVLDFRGELITFSEPDDEGENETKLFFNPDLTITSKLSEKLVLQSRLNRSIERKSLSEHYFYQDYVALNPFLRMPKSWNGLISLKYQSIVAQASRLNIKLSGFAKQVDDLVVLYPSAQSRSKFWYPDNIDAFLYGGELSFDLSTDRFEFSAKYIHEIQEPDTVTHIPYRPAEQLEFDLAYRAQYGIGIEFGGEFYGPRFVDIEEDEKLDSYFIGRTKLSKELGEYGIIFIGVQFGESEPLRGYEFSETFVDFGFKLTI